MVGGNGRNQFRQYAGQMVWNQNGYNVVQNVSNQVVQNVVQNLGIYNVGTQNVLIVVPGIANQNANQNGNGNVVAARAEGDLDEIEEVNANCILMANLQQASTSGTQTDKALVYDSDGSAENDSNVIFAVSSVEQSGGTVEHNPATVKETHAYFESLYYNLAIEVEKVNTVNRKMKETNADLTTKLARYKNQEKYFQINQEIYDKLERCYQKSVYQEQCLTKKINALHLSSAKTITTLNEEIANLNNQLLKAKSTVSNLQQDKKKLKSDFKIREDELPDKQIQLEQKIKELDNILAKSREELYFSNTSKTESVSKSVSKSISIPNEEFSDDTSPSVARKFLNEVKSTIVTLQRVVKQKMTLDIHNWSSTAHQELHKIVKDEIFPVVNQVDARVQNFKIQFLKEASKFVRDFKSLAKEADESLAKHKSLKYEIEHLLRAVVSQDIMSIVQSNSVVDTSNLQTELDHTKEKLETCIIKKEKEYDVLWNNWYKKFEEYKYDMISYDKAFNDMQQKIQRLQAQLGDLKGKSKDAPCLSDTLDLSRKLEDENASLEFQVLNYVKENAHLKTTYKSLFDSIKVTRVQTKTITDSLQDKLHDTIYENAKLRAQLFDKVSEQTATTNGTSANTNFANQSTSGTKLYSVTPLPKTRVPLKVVEPNDLSNPVTSNSAPTTKESKVMKNDKVVAPGKFRINPFKTFRVENVVPSKPVKARVRTNSITVSQPNVITKQDVNSNSNGLSSTRVDNTAKTRRPQPRSNTKNDRKFLGTVRFGNDHIAAIWGYGDLQWGNILITKVYFVEGLRHNLFSVGQFCDSDLEVAFRRNTCFVINLEGVDLLKGNRTTNLYTINLHEMASASPICLMARATSTKSWLWHQRLSHLNFDTINDLAKNDLVTGLPKFKYHKEHLCPSCEQGKSKKASHPPKPVPNSKQRLRLLHMDLCGPMRVDSISGKRYVLVIVDDYSRYTWVHFLRSKDEAPEEIKTFLKKITVLLQAPVIITEAIATACYIQNRSIIHRQFVKTPYELINGIKSDISFLHVFGAFCYPKNDHEDIGKLGAKGDIDFFIGYSANYRAYREYNRRTRKIMETMKVTFDEHSAMAFEQRSSKPGL
ncbi:retrovirus-related pol polyprotein from transposon TNT 1-94 [Tanacetum coccineum]